MPKFIKGKYTNIYNMRHTMVISIKGLKMIIITKTIQTLFHVSHAHYDILFTLTKIL